MELDPSITYHVAITKDIWKGPRDRVTPEYLTPTLPIHLPSVVIMANMGRPLNMGTSGVGHVWRIYEAYDDDNELNDKPCNFPFRSS